MNPDYQRAADFLIRFERRGEGLPVLLLHGGGTWSFSYRLLVPQLARDYTVITLDLPGHGYTTSALGRPRYDLPSITAALRDFVYAQRLGPMHVCGNSWGGGFALRLAQVHPECVASLVLLAPSGFRHREIWPYELLRFPILSELGRWAFTRKQVRWMYRKAFFDPSRVTEEMVAAVHEPLLRIENRRAQVELMRRLDWALTERDMGSTRARTLVIWGRQDRLWPVEMADRFARTMPNCVSEVWDRCGHLPQEEHPERLVERLTAFWSD
jgi:pimeloyl-ACP methyl ester carboxylesterase